MKVKGTVGYLVSAGLCIRGKSWLENDHFVGEQGKFCLVLGNVKPRSVGIVVAESEISYRQEDRYEEKKPFHLGSVSIG